MRAELSSKLCKYISRTLTEFEKETGFMVSEIDISIDKHYIFGQVKPIHTFSNVNVKLAIEEQLGV